MERRGGRVEVKWRRWEGRFKVWEISGVGGGEGVEGKVGCGFGLFSWVSCEA